MKFIVTRTSVWDDKKSPCEEAKHDSIIECIKKEMYNVWSVELNTFDELMEFTNKYGRIVISDWWLNKDYKEIEIYDTYRE